MNTNKQKKINYPLTLSLTNKARINCPIFDTQVNVASCVALRDKVWRGEHIDVRRGCQACMRCSKCPVAELVSKICFGSDYPDNLASTEPKLIALSEDVLRRIENVVVLDNIMNHLGVPDIERQLIDSSRSRIEKALAKAPSSDKNKVVFSATKRSSNKTKRVNTIKNATENNKQDLKSAAIRGDLSAAINYAQNS